MTINYCVSNYFIIKFAIHIVFGSLILVGECRAKECGEMDIRNTPKQLKALEDCTVIAGSLQIVLIEESSSDEFAKYSFPKLREITGYLLISRVFNLTSLGQLFPNLMVIRGQQLVRHYAFVLFELNQLEEIGLKSLIKIERGFVAIRYCPLLCYSKTIDWNVMTTDVESQIRGTGNILQPEESQRCNIKNQCKKCKSRNCWNERHCQKFDLGQHNSKCHPQCLGGCFNETAEGCFVCRGPKDNGTCIASCHESKFLYPQTMKCVTEEVCKNHLMIPFNKECHSDCPSGYSRRNGAERCYLCEKDECPKKCNTPAVLTVATTDELRGCNIIDGHLEISINVDVENAQKRLERNLGDITEIRGYLKVHRSLAITSLAFLKNLTTIYGENELVYGKFAISIYENPNLQVLWDWNYTKPITIKNGSMFVQRNTKLCRNEITKLKASTIYNDSNDYIEIESNGFDEQCIVSRITCWAMVNTMSSCWIFWEYYEIDEHLELLGYFLYYIEAPTQNVSYFIGIDACSRHSWKSYFISSHYLSEQKNNYSLLLPNLKQHTQYAYYIKTHISVKGQDDVSNVTQGQSVIQYFKTFPSQPTAPILTSTSKTEDSITISWQRTTADDELIESYFLEIFEYSTNVTQLDERNYCQYPVESKSSKVSYVIGDVNETVFQPLPNSSEPSYGTNCCQQNDPSSMDERVNTYIGIQKNKNCGIHDPFCNATFEYNKFKLIIEEFLSNIEMNDSESNDSNENQIPFFSNTTRNSFRSHIISNSLSEMVISDLKPFTLYIFLIYACNAKAGCGSYYMHTDKTLPIRTSLQIILHVERMENGQTYLTFQEPDDPNKSIVAYNIERTLLGNLSVTIDCITRKQHVLNDFKYDITRFQTEAYAFRINVVSLLQFGHYSHYIYPQLKTDSTTQGSLVIGGIVLTIIIVLFVTFMLNYISKVRVRFRRSHEDILLQNIVSHPEHTDDERTSTMTLEEDDS